MTKIDKLIARLLTRPKNFTYSEACAVLSYFGFTESNKGKMPGSRWNSLRVGIPSCLISLIIKTIEALYSKTIGRDPTGDELYLIGFIIEKYVGQLKYRGYTGSVEYSNEDSCLYGKVQGLKGTLISYEGETVDEIQRNFRKAVDCYLESCKERGIEPQKPYSGRLVLRMSSDIHGRIAVAAAAAGTTINVFINKALLHEISTQPPVG